MFIHNFRKHSVVLVYSFGKNSFRYRMAYTIQFVAFQFINKIRVGLICELGVKKKIEEKKLRT